MFFLVTVFIEHGLFAIKAFVSFFMNRSEEGLKQAKKDKQQLIQHFHENIDDAEHMEKYGISDGIHSEVELDYFEKQHRFTEKSGDEKKK